MDQYPKWEAFWERFGLPMAIVLVTAVTIGIYFENRSNKRESEELAVNGITTTGILDARYRQRNVLGRSEYEITYNFEANGHRYSKTVTVDERPTSSDVKIVYLPKDPNTSRLVEFSRRTHWEDVLTAAVIAGIVIIVMLAWRFSVSLYRRGRH